MSEYLRALKLKSDDRKEDAIKLFSELLDAEAFDQVYIHTCVCGEDFFFYKNLCFTAGHQM